MTQSSQTPAEIGSGPVTGGFSIRRLRTLILIALVAGVAVFTGVMFTLVQSLSERFGPQVAADLEWRAARGAQELAKTADVGLAVSDTAMVKEAFGAYAESSDVQAIVAVDAQGQVVASHGQIASIDPVFAARPMTLVHGDGYVASWAPAVIEGNQVGKVALVVSTHRLSDAQGVLSRVSDTTLVAGLAGALLGALVILFFTRQVSIRDHQLNDYAHNLEAKVETRTRELDERNRGMRVVLDNVAQGFLTIDLDGALASERSAIVDRWFGAPGPGVTFAAYIGRRAPDFATWFELGLEGMRDGFLPAELCIAQMPRRFTAGESTFEVEYSPIMRGEVPERILLIVSDVTERMVRERAEREQREMVALFQRITADRAGFDEFLDEASALVGSLASAGDPVVERRTIHTLKGNCAIYGLESYAALCHEAETEHAEHAGPITAEWRTRLTDAWRDAVARLARLVGGSRRNAVEVEFAELARVVDKVRQGLAGRELAAVLTGWSHEPVARRFERLGNHAVSLARRLGKGDVEIAIVDDGIRLDTARWAPFWSAMVHAVRNAVDHGIEPPEQRVRGGKSARPKLTFTATRARGRLLISVADDGGGIDWEAVRVKAREAGLPAESQADLEQALFSDGLSTARVTTDTSGRGVGMGALREAVAALGGSVEIESTAGAGTVVRYRFPEADGQILPLRPPTQPNFHIA
ncbi:MAG TPA: ATP-binding protein [Kofleriaceae bacterium]|jgi:two-component system chemotaxis sensor kinase CheA|nr:ATP-binding protein [Kofleriaceae bacterium]